MRRICRAICTANFAQLYYLVARLWLVFGSSDAWLRSLSVLFAALAVVVTAATVGRILDRRAAVVAGVLLATNPFFVDYAREARAYSLVVLLTSCSWYLLVRGWWNGSTRWRAAYGLCLLALAATHVVVSKDHWPNARRPEARQRRVVAVLLAEGASVVVDNTNPAPEDRAAPRGGRAPSRTSVPRGVRASPATRGAGRGRQ